MPYRRYLRDVNDKFGFLATWLPNQKIALGDIGTLEKGVFRRQESLGTLGYEIEQDHSDVPIEFDHSSGSRLAFSADAQAKAGASGLSEEQSALANIEFSQSGGFVMRAVGCMNYSLASRAALHRAILNARTKGIWCDDWVVIDQLYVAAGFTLLVCSSSSGSITLSASGSAGVAGFDIARGELGISATAWSGDITKVVAGAGLTPMFSATRLRTGFFFADRMDTASLPRLKGAASPGDVVTVSIQDALDEE